MILIYFAIFVFGLIIGSFLNVVIFRLESEEKIVNDRSKCLHCKHLLAWYDLVPVFSFIFLKGKCRYCKKKISWQYPIVEIMTGILFVLVVNYKFEIINIEYLTFNLQYFFASIFFYIYLIAALVVIFFYDLRHYIIPDKVIYPAIIVAFIYKIFYIFEFGSWRLFGIWNSEFGILSSFLQLLLPAFLAGGFFYAIIVITKGKGMGGGDVKLGFLMGLVLGLPLVLVALFLSFIIGSVIGIFLILIGNKKMKSMIPFGPFLVLGTVIALFWGEKIMRWYFGMIF